MLADLVSFFGGRAAEEVKFNSVTTGASNDIERATAIARAMVTQYGMSDEFGLIGFRVHYKPILRWTCSYELCRDNSSESR